MIFLIVFICCSLEIGVNGKSYNLPQPIDLSHTVDEKTMTWNESSPFQITNRIVKDLSNTSFYSANEFCTPEHAGTHLDAPYHFDKKGMKVAEIPLNYLLGPGIIVNVTEIVKKNGSDFQLQPEHLDKWVKEQGEIPENTIVLIDFGWSCKYRSSNRTSYFGAQSPPYSFPGISVGAAEWIVKSGRIRGVGVDTASMDYGKSESLDVHQQIAKAGLFGLENVDLCDKNLPAKGFDLIVLPMKMGEGTGAPVRIVAV